MSSVARIFNVVENLKSYRSKADVGRFPVRTPSGANTLA